MTSKINILNVYIPDYSLDFSSANIVPGAQNYQQDSQALLKTHIQKII